MAIILAVISEAASLARKRSYKISIVDSCCLEFLPQESSPTTLYVVSLGGYTIKGGNYTGEPVILSPSAFMRTVEESTSWETSKKAMASRNLTNMVRGSYSMKKIVESLKGDSDLMYF